MIQSTDSKSHEAQKKWASSEGPKTARKLLESVPTGDIYDDAVISAENAEASLAAKTVDLAS